MASEFQVKHLTPKYIGSVVTVSVVEEDIKTVTYTGVLQAWVDTDEVDPGSETGWVDTVRTLIISGQVTGEVSRECDIVIH